MISNNKKGFTLVELLVTIGIIGIILIFSTVSVYTIINNSKENSNKLTIDIYNWNDFATRRHCYSRK